MNIRTMFATEPAKRSPQMESPREKMLVALRLFIFMFFTCVYMFSCFSYGKVALTACAKHSPTLSALKIGVRITCLMMASVLCSMYQTILKLCSARSLKSLWLMFHHLNKYNCQHTPTQFLSSMLFCFIVCSCIFCKCLKY